MFNTLIQFSTVFIFWALCISDVGGKSGNRPVTSFKDESGQNFDCFDIYKQPALSHPALKNHKIQMRPSSYPKGMMQKQADVANNAEEIKMNGPTCPEGSVPYMRINKKKNLKNQRLSEIPNNNTRGSIAQTAEYNYAMMQMYTKPNVKYYGAHAFIQIYNPKAVRSQYSKSMVWIQNQDEEKGATINHIQAGLMVNPSLYGGKRTRFFTQWTADNNHKTGCYDKFCPGFVQVHQEFGPGTIVQNISTIGGQGYYYKVLLNQDRKTGNWWLQVGNGYANIGYFPKEIFTSLKDCATQIAWGGEVHTDLKDLGSPEMGSGLLPSEGPGKAAFFSDFKVVDDSGNRQIPKIDQYEFVATNPKCYDIAFSDAVVVLYGGPGGNCN